MKAFERLKKQKENVIKQWENRVLAGIPAAKLQTRYQIRNSVPYFLDLLIESLSASPLKVVTGEEINQASIKHGQQRSNLEGYSIYQIITEYQLLRETILKILEAEEPISYEERDLILAAIEQGMAEASARFALLTTNQQYESEERIRLVLEGIKDHAIILTDTLGKVTDWNSGAEKIFLYTRKEILGLSSEVLFTPEDRSNQVPQEEMQVSSETGKAEDKRFHLKKDGSLFFANGIMNPLKSNDGAILGFVKVLRDDTKRKTLDEELETARAMVAESEAKFRQIANSLPLIIWTATPEFHVDWYNDWWYKYLKLPMGTRWDSVETSPMHPEDVIKTLDKVAESIRTGQDFTMEQRFKRGQDEQYRWHLVRGVPLRNANGEIIKWVGANTDIHDQKILLQKLEEERELREKFVSTLSHDLRTSLTSAKIGAQVLARKMPIDSKQIRTAHRISDSMDRAERLIRNLLDASVLSAGQTLPLKKEWFNLRELSQEVIEDQTISHGDKFVLISDGQLEGSWDKDAIKRILDNLISNAIKYGSSESLVTASILGLESEVIIKIHNEGKPIPKEYHARLFEQYNRADSLKSGAVKGWGLGLTLVQGLAEAHGGMVNVTSSESEGTTFTVRLPKDSGPDLIP